MSRTSFVAAALALAACAEEATPAPGEEPIPPAPDGPHALYSADPGSVLRPWPDDALREFAGAPAIAAGFAAAYLPAEARTPGADALLAGWAAQLALQDGFGTFAPALVRFSEPPDAASLEGTLTLLRLGDGGGPVPLSEIRLATHAPFAQLYPAAPLAGGTRHAVALLAGARTAAAEPLVRSKAFHEFAYGDGAALVAEVAAAAGVATGDVLVATAFTTLHPAAELRAAAAAVPTPERLTATSVSRAGEPALAELYGGDPPASVGLVATGTFPSRDLRGPDGAFAAALAADPASAPALDVPFLLVLPAGGAPPYPVVLVLHGIGGSKEYGLTVARELSAAGRAVLAIDGSSNGDRGNLGGLFNVVSLAATRDHFRTTALDLVQLQKLVQAGRVDVDGVAGPDLDPASVGFFGNSMGALMGAVYSGIAPEGLSASVLNVGGGGLSRLLAESQLEIAVRVLLSAELEVGHESEALEQSLPVLLGVAQAILDTGDPISFGPVPGSGEQRAVLLQEAVGDLVIPNSASEALAAAYELAPPEAAGPRAERAVLVRYRREDFPALPAEAAMHDLYGELPAMRAQATRFLTSSGADLCDAGSGGCE